MYTALIIDDNNVARVMLAGMLSKIEGITVAGEFEDAFSAISYLEKNKTDLLFLDVEMPDMSGLDLLRVLKERPLTILVTAKAVYAAEAFELNVVDYLVKPFSLSRVIAAVERAKELLRVSNTGVNHVAHDHIFVKDGKTIRKIYLQHVLWIEAKGDYVKILTAEGNYIIHTTLRNLEEKLSGSEFIRIHRSYIVPVSRIEYIAEGAAYVQGTALPVSENYKHDLFKNLRLI